MRAYCVFENFRKEAIDLIRSNGIKLVINNSKNRPNGEELIFLLKKYDILIIGVSSKITADMLKYIEKPKIIATLSVGLDHIDKEVLDSKLITVVNIKEANSVSVAEHIFSLILALNKRIYESTTLVLKGEGHRNNVYDKPEDISNKILGLIGAGNITKEVIRIARVFNMKIKCHTKNPDKHKELKDLDVEFVSLEDLLKESDIINVSVPLTEETRKLISRDEISIMKPNVTFINTSRTEIVDTEYLMEYADLNKNFYVGLDIDINNYKDILMKYRQNVIVTPHIAGISKQAIARMDLELATRIIDIK